MAEFVAQEGTLSTFQALISIVREHGRFCESYTDRGSHFCRTAQAGQAPAEEQQGQDAQALRALGIRHIPARSPQARGAQRTRLSKQGKRYLKAVLVQDFNRRFTVSPARPESAFTPLAGIDLDLLLSAKHERLVHNDETVTFKRVILQLPTTPTRMHFVRSPVIVRQFANGQLGVSYQGRCPARYDAEGTPLPTPINLERASRARQRLASTKSCPALHRTAGANPESIVFRQRSRSQRGATGEKTAHQSSG